MKKILFIFIFILVIIGCVPSPSSEPIVYQTRMYEVHISEEVVYVCADGLNGVMDGVDGYIVARFFYKGVQVAGFQGEELWFTSKPVEKCSE